MTEKLRISNVLGHVNQFDVRVNNKNYFYSYNSLCCVLDFDSDVITFGRDRDYSKTTLKHLYAFLSDNYFSELNSKKLVQKAIENGKIGDWSVKYCDDMR